MTSQIGTWSSLTMVTLDRTLSSIESFTSWEATVTSLKNFFPKSSNIYLYYALHKLVLEFRLIISNMLCYLKSWTTDTFYKYLVYLAKYRGGGYESVVKECKTKTLQLTETMLIWLDSVCSLVFKMTAVSPNAMVNAIP